MEEEAHSTSTSALQRQPHSPLLTTHRESRPQAHVLTDEVIRIQLALLGAVRDIATGIQDLNNTLKDFLNIFGK